MKRARFSEEQIITILKEAEGGAKVTELCRRHGISDATFYTWRSKYGGLEVSEMRRLRQLEEENWRLKSIVARRCLKCCTKLSHSTVIATPCAWVSIARTQMIATNAPPSTPGSGPQSDSAEPPAN
jgi:putative transposase